MLCHPCKLVLGPHQDGAGCPNGHHTNDALGALHNALVVGLVQHTVPVKHRLLFLACLASCWGWGAVQRRLVQREVAVSVRDAQQLVPEHDQRPDGA